MPHRGNRFVENENIICTCSIGANLFSPIRKLHYAPLVRNRFVATDNPPPHAPHRGATIRGKWLFFTIFQTIDYLSFTVHVIGKQFAVHKLVENEKVEIHSQSHVPHLRR